MRDRRLDVDTLRGRQMLCLHILQCLIRKKRQPSGSIVEEQNTAFASTSLLVHSFSTVESPVCPFIIFSIPYIIFSEHFSPQHWQEM